MHVRARLLRKNGLHTKIKVVRGDKVCDDADTLKVATTVRPNATGLHVLHWTRVSAVRLVEEVVVVVGVFVAILHVCPQVDAQRVGEFARHFGIILAERKIFLLLGRLVLRYLARLIMF